MKPSSLARLASLGLLGACALGACGYDFKGWKFDAGAGGAASASAATNGTPSATSGGGAQTVTSSTGAGGSGGSGGSAAGGGCAESPCKLVAPQCGCAATDECTIDANNGMRMCVAAGTGVLGGPCGGASACLPGLGCLGGVTTVCSQFCAVDADCNAGLCVVQYYDATNMPVPGVLFCSAQCEPISNAGCAQGLSCQLASEEKGAKRDYTVCADAGQGAQGAACSSSSDCQVGFGCFNVNNADHCMRYCDPAGAQGPPCPDPEQCGGLTDPALKPYVVNGINYGACY